MPKNLGILKDVRLGTSLVGAAAGGLIGVSANNPTGEELTTNERLRNGLVGAGLGVVGGNMIGGAARGTIKTAKEYFKDIKNPNATANKRAKDRWYTGSEPPPKDFRAPDAAQNHATSTYEQRMADLKRQGKYDELAVEYSNLMRDLEQAELANPAGAKAVRKQYARMYHPDVISNERARAATAAAEAAANANRKPIAMLPAARSKFNHMDDSFSNFGIGRHPLVRGAAVGAAVGGVLNGAYEGIDAYNVEKKQLAEDMAKASKISDPALRAKVMAQIKAADNPGIAITARALGGAASGAILGGTLGYSVQYYRKGKQKAVTRLADDVVDASVPMSNRNYARQYNETYGKDPETDLLRKNPLYNPEDHDAISYSHMGNTADFLSPIVYGAYGGAVVGATTGLLASGYQINAEDKKDVALNASYLASIKDEKQRAQATRQYIDEIDSRKLRQQQKQSAINSNLYMFGGVGGAIAGGLLARKLTRK